MSKINIFVPAYYRNFKCIADKCKHSCCIGWEIDIDDESAERYRNMKGDDGEWVRSNISDDNPPHFVLGSGDRCPFLKENGLCDMILKLGEESLCDICNDHPRFRNFFDNFEEMGLGLCCEEAARVILTCEEPFSLEILEGDKFVMPEDDEDFYIAYRQRFFEILSDRRKNITERFNEVLSEFRFRFADFELENLCETLLSMEHLEEEWPAEIEKMKKHSPDMSIFDDKKFQVAFEQLACYFLFRHFCDALYDGRMAERVKFSLAGCYIIGMLCSMKEDAGIYDMIDYARRYSAEVEYSEENTEMLLSAFEK